MEQLGTNVTDALDAVIDFNKKKIAKVQTRPNLVISPLKRKKKY